MKIQVTNHSTVVGADELATMVAACAAQIRDDFAPAWEMVPPTIEHSGATDPSAYQMGIFDTSDSPGALGYHDNDEQGKPRGFVFAKSTIADGGKVSVTLSHELIEMVLDPSCSLWSLGLDGKMRAFEAADAVESDTYTKKVGNDDVEVSNFLLRAYFVETPLPGQKTDFLDRLNGKTLPARTPGGYDIVVGINGEPTQEFSESFALLSHEKACMKAFVWSRTSRKIKHAKALRALVMTLYVLIGGCSTTTLNRNDPPIAQSPCDANNPYWCGDTSRTCCDSSLPVCRTDDDGRYCTASETANPSDPVTWSARKRRGPRHPAQ